MTEQIPIPLSLSATRDAAKAQVLHFKPRMGRRYASGRNYDRGAGRHRDVSQLSPYLRRRLVLEHDVVQAALEAHGPEGAEKFIQEVIWRGYFKGWLERRPQVWRAYRDGLERDRQSLENDKALRQSVERAEAGKTDLEYFNAWARELIDTGYLHNHARMWFASIWIFTLDLPWRLGADFFYRHLLDGDPASNTLSWRWVAGLHTRGKPYQAQAWNIAKFTENRFEPGKNELEEVTQGLEGLEPDGLPDLQPLRTPNEPRTDLPSALLITEEDCRPDDFPLGDFDIKGTATLVASGLRSDLPTSRIVAEFEAEALADTARQLGGNVTAMTAGNPKELADWAVKLGATQIITPYIPEGPLRDWICAADSTLQDAGITFAEWRREWDSLLWPHATAGFFKVKKKIPDVLRKSGLL